MKKYWKIISLCTLTVLILGTFYIQSSLAAKEDIGVVFEKVSGDEKEVEDIIFHGDYEVGRIYHSLRFSVEETEKIQDLSLLQSLKRVHSLPILVNLVENYKGFMRGKDLSPTHFYENDDLLAYAGIEREQAWQSSLELEVLNKTSKKTNSFVINVPDSAKYSWLMVEEVQVIDSMLKVFIRGTILENGATEISLYSFDLEQQKFDKSEVLDTTTQSENVWTDIRTINDYHSIGQQKYLLFYTETHQMHTEMQVEENVDSDSLEVTIYDLETEQSHNLSIPENLFGMLHAASVNGSTLYIPTHAENGYEVSQYDMEKQKWEDELIFDLPVTKKLNSSQPFMKVMKGKMYIVNASENGHSLFISDLKTGKMLYEGAMKVKYDGNVQSNYRLYIHDMVPNQ